MQLLKSAGILLLIIGATLSILGFILEMTNQPDMFSGMITGPIINIIALTMLLAYFVFHKDNTHKSV